MHDMTRVFWHGHNGSVFTLSGDLEVQGVVLRDVDGLVSQVSRTIRGRSNARGGDVRGRVIEVMPGSLSVEILPDPGAHQTLPEVWERWKASWSTGEDRPGKIRLLTRTGEWSVPAIAESNITTPNPGPSSPGLAQFTSRVDVLALDGIWSGTPRNFKDVEIFQVGNAGTVDLHPEVFWSGAGESFTLPSGRRILLPAVTGEHRLTLDPGQGFKVWGPDGVDAPSVWASFRGLDVRGPIPAGETREFRCSPNAWVRATPLHENPWG